MVVMVNMTNICWYM